MADRECYDWWLYELPSNGHKTKKERKKEYQKWRYNRALRNWRRAEPAPWRFIAHWLWQRLRPKEA